MDNSKRISSSRTLPIISSEHWKLHRQNDPGMKQIDPQTAPELKPLTPISINAMRRTARAFKEQMYFPEKPKPVQATTIKLVESETQQRREQDIANALAIISQSMEPPPHFMDQYRDTLMEKLETVKNPDRWYWRWLRHLLTVPFFRIRSTWHYIILPAPLFYNLGLMFLLYFTTPPMAFFAFGVGLFWLKIVYELYRDIMHRDDVLYRSNVPKDLSIMAAISAGIGLILRMKAEAGEITLQWVSSFFT